VAVGIARLSLDLRTGALIFLSGTPALVVLVVVAGVLVLGKPNLIGLAQGLLALLYLGSVALAGHSTWEALGLVSLGILLVGELSQWSFDSRVRGRYEAGLHVSRVIGMAWLLALGLGVLLLAGLATGLPLQAGLWGVAAATAASVALLALVSTIALRVPDRAASGPSSNGG
jgi:hypothetical protein